MKKIVSLVVAACMLNGCGSLGSKKVSMDHANYRELISSKFVDDLWIPIEGSSINMFATDEANAPRDSLSIYCQRDGGNLEQISTDKDVLRYHKEVLNLSGIFACKTASNTNLWMVDVDARQHRGGLNKGGTFGYLFHVREYSTDKYESNIAQQKRNAELAARKKTEHLAHFQKMVSLTKSQGEKICTWNNKYGFVEELSGNKVKILVKGAARGVVDGFFFLEGAHRFRTTPMNEYIWDDTGNWGACEFTQ